MGGEVELTRDSTTLRVRPTPQPPSDWYIVLFDRPLYRGTATNFTGAVADLAGHVTRTQSVVVGRGVWQLCRGRDFSGRCATMNRSVADISVMGFGSRFRSLRPVLPPAARGTAGTRLEATRWRLTEVGGRRAVDGEASGHAYVQFERDGGRVSGSTGCNQLTGSFSGSASTLRFQPGTTTRMACLDRQISQQELAFLGALQSTERYEITGNTLTLIGPRGPVARLMRVSSPGQ